MIALPVDISALFRSAPHTSDVASFEDVRRAVNGHSGAGGMVVLDVRKPREREEPGRIPGTKNVPCKTLIVPQFENNCH